ncbi:MAG: class I SAM-dependent methyltransferase [Lentilitoribacter sp.]
MNHDIYEPEHVSALFDRCAGNYRIWSEVSSFGFVYRWRNQCIGKLAVPPSQSPVILDLMAGTGETWPMVLKKLPHLSKIIAIDISHQMHLHAIEKLHKNNNERIEHTEADILEYSFEDEIADGIVCSFGLKTFNKEQQELLADQVYKMLKPGGTFSFIEASDPVNWRFRRLYRLYLDHLLPLIEKVFLKGAQDFSMIGTYTKAFGNCEHFAKCLEAKGLKVTQSKYFFGCASGVTGEKPD